MLDIFVSVLAVMSPVLLALLGAVGWMYKHERETRAAVERQLSERKYEAYTLLVDTFLQVLTKVKTNDKIDESELTEKMLDVNKRLLIYGSDEVVKAFQGWLRSAWKGNPNFSGWGALFVAIRKDMGHPKTQIKPEDVLRAFIVDYDDAKQKGIV